MQNNIWLESLTYERADADEWWRDCASTVGSDLSVARETLRGELNAFQVDADLILQRLALGENPRVIHNAGMMEHIFGEMYLYL